MRFFKTWFSIS